MKIRLKLLLAPAVGIAVLLVFGGVMLASMLTQRRVLEEIWVERVGELEFSARLNRDLGQAHTKAYRLFTWIEAFSEEKVKAKTAEILGSVDQSIQAIEAHIASPRPDDHAREPLRIIAGEAKTYRKQAADALDVAAVDVQMAMAMMQASDESFLRMEGTLIELVQKNNALAEQSYVGAQDRFRSVMLTAALLLVFAVAASAIVSLITARQIMRPLNDAQRAAERIAGGDLSVELDAHARDEIGDLLRSLEAMRQKLKGMIASIRDSASSVSQSSRDLAASADNVATASRQQSDNAASMAAALEELAVSIHQMADNANAARRLSTESRDVSRTGGEVIQRTVEEMNVIADTVNRTATAIEGLGDRSAEISQVLLVIKDIAEQTNLLALNAAIEAARAGEQGRGFAVVADEVRKLAERAAKSTDEISQVIESIQSGAKNAVVVMGRAVGLVDSGVALAAQAGDATQQITSRAGDMELEVSAISDALKEQGSASSDLAVRVENIVRISEENSNSACSSAAAAAELQKLAGQMIADVGRFRV